MSMMIEMRVRGVEDEMLLIAVISERRVAVVVCLSALVQNVTRAPVRVH